MSLILKKNKLLITSIVLLSLAVIATVPFSITFFETMKLLKSNSLEGLAAIFLLIICIAIGVIAVALNIAGLVTTIIDLKLRIKNKEKLVTTIILLVIATLLIIYFIVLSFVLAF